tara:strand:- start:11270 stop:11842 length:573 start_codon:yes stop_codon:yes gene_type:complete
MNTQDTMNEGTHDEENVFETEGRFAPMTGKRFYGEDGEDSLRWLHTEAYAYARMLNMAGIKIEALKDVYEGDGYHADADTTYETFARICGATYEDAGWMVSWDGNEGEGQPLRVAGWFRAIMGNGAGEFLADGSLTAYHAWDLWRYANPQRKQMVALVERMAHHRESGIPDKAARLNVVNALLDALSEVA